MQLHLVLAGTFRQEALTSEGIVLPREQNLLIPLADLSHASRTIIVQENPKLENTLYLKIPSQVASSYPGKQDDFESSLVPTSPQEWDTLFASFVEARATRKRENLAVRQEELDGILTKLRELSLQQEGPYSYYPYPFYSGIGKEYAQCTGYEEALALKAEIDGRNAAYKEQEREKKLAKERAVQQEREQREQDKRTWIATHGSSSLQKKVEAGYDSQRQYAYERAAMEWPSYRLDFDDTAHWSERFTPSDEAFAEAHRVHGQVVWLTTPVQVQDEDEDYEWDGPCEAVVIRNYLDRYDLVKQIG